MENVGMLKVIGIVALLTIRANSSPVDRSRLGKSLWPFVASDSPGSEDGEGLRVWKFVPDDGQIPAEFLDLRPNERSRIWRVKIPAVDPKAIQPEVKQQNLGIRQDDEFSGYFIGPVVPVSLDQAIISSTEAVDLSFLDDLGGLAPFLPDPHQDPGDSFEDRLQLLNSSTAGSTSSRQDSQASPSYSFLRWLLSKLTFGLVGETPASSQSPTPATYQPPKTKSTYIAYRLPVNEESEITIMKTAGHRARISADPVEPKKPFYSQDTERRSVGPNPNLQSARIF